MHVCRQLVISVLSAAACLTAAAAVPDNYIQINNNSGLSNSSVTTIFQDSSDEMWFGTWNGLNRYDGSEIKQFRPQSSSNKAISHQVIRSISEDSDGYLWIATDFGINRMDRDDETFSVYYIGYDRPYIYEEGLFSCCVSDEGQVAAALKGGKINLYDKSADKFSSLPGCGPDNFSAVLFFDMENRLWAETEDGSLTRICISDGRAAEIVRIPLAAGHGTPLFDGKDRIWIQTGDTVSYIGTDEEIPEARPAGFGFRSTLNTVKNIGGTLYAGTTSGCFRIGEGGLTKDLDGEKIAVLSIFKGTQDILWIGTDGLGVLQEKYDPEFISAIYPPPAAFSGKFPVRAILSDSRGNVFIGSKGGGLSVWNKKRNDFRSFNVGTGRTYNSVLSLEQAGNRIYIGTDGAGLMYMTDPEGKPEQLDFSGYPESRLISSVYAIEKSGKDTLFLGTSGNGLFMLVTDGRGKVRSIANYRHEDMASGTIGSNIIYDIVNDGPYLWLATRGGGINRFDKKTGKVEIVPGSNAGQSISNDILSLLLDSSHRLWAGTSSGLVMIRENEEGLPVTRVFDDFPEISNTSVHSILEGADGSIWISTDNGIARLDRGAESIASWTHDDGLSDNEYCDGAGFAADSGSRLYFGSINGVDIIMPGLAGQISFMPKLNLSMVEVDNSRYYPEGNVIGTDYRTGSISFWFSLPDYISGEKCSVVYFLKRGRDRKTDNIGDSDWIDIGKSRQIIVSQLRPGNYTLLVRAADANHNLGEPQSWLIEVSWPKLLKPWLIILYICIAAAIACILYWLHRSRKAIAEELEKEKRDNAVREEIIKGKFRFFTNIAHEFSNSITLIFGAVEQILTTGNQDSRYRKQLIAIRSNADRMHKQIEELMEFSKADYGHLAVLYEKVDVNELLKYTFDNFIDIAESKKITMDINVDKNLPVWVSDRSMLEKIVFNLLSNAMKYTPSEGWIRITAGRDGSGELEIKVANSGPGIPKDRLSDIFDRYVILDNFESKLSHGHYTRTGIGLSLCKDLTGLLGGKISADSRENEYTVFSVTLPWKDDTEISMPSGTIPERDETGADAGHESGQKAVVLVVDDFKDIRMLIADILSEEFDICQAADGETALEMMKEVSPALIICDMIMPGMGGIAFVKKVKSDENTRHIPVVMLSSDTDIENRVNAIDTGADVFIAKPFHPRYLKAVVERIFSAGRGQASEYNPLEKALGSVDMQGADSGDNTFVSKVMDALSKNYGDENYNQDALAYDLAMSRVQLYRKVKHDLGSTPGELIRRYRIRQAELMLRKTDKTVQEIMYDCGFHNKAYFYREFSRLHNCSPKDFRNGGVS